MATRVGGSGSTEVPRKHPRHRGVRQWLRRLHPRDPAPAKPNRIIHRRTAAPAARKWPESRGERRPGTPMRAVARPVRPVCEATRNSTWVPNRDSP